jgi:hypothetical protein
MLTKCLRHNRALCLLASDWEIHLASRVLEVADSQAERRVLGGPRLPPRFPWPREADFLFPKVCVGKRSVWCEKMHRNPRAQGC